MPPSHASSEPPEHVTLTTPTIRRAVHPRARFGKVSGLREQWALLFDNLLEASTQATSIEMNVPLAFRLSHPPASWHSNCSKGQ